MSQFAFDAPTPPAPARAGLRLPGGTETKPLTVGQVNALIQQVLSGTLPPVFYIAGELSNFRTYDRGHAFFTLKEPGAELPAVMWRDNLARLKFRPKDGMAVIARGLIKMYEPQGKVQLYADLLLPQGAGALELAFRQLCEKLKAEGLFEPERKRPIPRLPQRVVIITSRTGDVLHDVLTTAYRRWPGLHTMLMPVRVQGEEAAPEIAAAIKTINKHAHTLADGKGVDLILLVRGGGSLEDLWAFNEEIVARAIVESKIPIATGIGHEPDTTIADLVGDLRGPTPTGVTELTVPDAKSLLREIDSTAAVLTRDISRQVRDADNQLARLLVTLTQTTRESVRRRARQLDTRQQQVQRIEPRHAIAQGWRRIDDTGRNLKDAAQRRLQRSRDRLAKLEQRLDRAGPALQLPRLREKLFALEAHLRAVSPQAVLDRGFSITYDENGHAVRSVAQVKTGDKLTTRVADGEIKSTVGTPRQASLF